MYTLEAIILDIFHVQDKKYRLILFTREYGRISAWWHKSLSGVDLGDVARIVIERKETMNRIRSFETKHFLIQKKWQYSSLIQTLQILNIFKKGIQEQEIYPHIFDDYMKFIQHPLSPNIDVCLLLQMRTLKYLGYLKPDFFLQDHTLKYIYTHISTTPLQKILHTKPLKSEHAHIIHSSNLYALSFFT